ncbi:MAG: maleylpyruvate isomerase N-terminal domain-containing protein [Pseudonocardiales bacterium]|nr:maleylpyruvate isomerase N-terminal domain-containing protein [Pseudonocardiales bacterium]
MEPFAHAVQLRRPDTGTWCEAWTTRDVLIHQTANAEELARVLGAHTAAEPVETRGFDRENPYRELTDPELWSAFIDRCEQLIDITTTAERDLPPDEEIMWTGRAVKQHFFAEHMREELVLHRWDLTGDDATAVRALTESWMTRHSVYEVGKALLDKGAAGLDLGVEGRIQGRLRSPGTDDVIVTATAQGNSIEFAKPDGPATIESDPAVRTLFL